MSMIFPFMISLYYENDSSLRMRGDVHSFNLISTAIILAWMYLINELSGKEVD